ncbi:MAG: hypothetical protein AAYR33_04320 [Acetobacteraceae bacterium]
MTGLATLFKLAACAEMLFTDLPITEHVREISARGFMVEIWDWTRHDIKALKATGVVFSSMTGYVSGGLVEEAAIHDFLSSVARSIPIAQELGITRLNIHGTGLGPTGLPVTPVPVVTPEMWMRARSMTSLSCWKTSIPPLTIPACLLRKRRITWP